MNTIVNLLESKVKLYNTLDYIETDPIQIPHRFIIKEDIEIASFLTATIAWGQRKTIIKNASFMMDLMENSPCDFVLNASEADLQNLRQFVHRTFNGVDLELFVRQLRNIYVNHLGLESVFTAGYKLNNTVYSALLHFREVFFESVGVCRTSKHISDVSTNSAAKRLNMMLRWLVRNDDCGVDFGIWNQIPMSALMIPLDVHVGNISRELGLLSRKQNDWKALEELMNVLRVFDAEDPVKYDYALFGMGVFNDSFL